MKEEFENVGDILNSSSPSSLLEVEESPSSLHGRGEEFKIPVNQYTIYLNVYSPGDILLDAVLKFEKSEEFVIFIVRNSFQNFNFKILKLEVAKIYSNFRFLIYTPQILKEKILSRTEIFKDIYSKKGNVESLFSIESNKILEDCESLLSEMSSRPKGRAKPQFGWKFVSKEMDYIPNEEEQETIEIIREITTKGSNLTYEGICSILHSLKRKCRRAKKWYSAQLKMIMQQNNIIIK